MSEPDSGLWLGIDTSTAVAVGVARPGVVLARGFVDPTNVHAEQLMPLVAATVAEAGIALGDLAGAVVGLGPGPFTGLRVGIVTAQTLAHALHIPLRGVCSLDVVAVQHATVAPGDFVVATDARRKELYWARYDFRGRRLDGPHVTYPSDLPDLPIVGPGAALYPDVIGERAGDPLRLDAGVLAAHAKALPGAGHEPLYLRRPDAQPPTGRKSALTRRDA